ncbi:MAG: HAD hydrolase-like protein [Rhodospirillaceae bacterium]|nr:HAD hydrolase-like protein [Rhodospirillaceae bacterium]
MRFKAVVFDFDGTLIDSADAKRDAFFRLFPAGEPYRAIVKRVLAIDPDGSRHDVIPRMIEAMTAHQLPLPLGQNAINRIGAYGQAVYAAQCAAAECPGAATLLRTLKGQTALYISSNTPEPDLTNLVAARGWSDLIDGLFGHPRDKSETLAMLVERHDGAKDDVAVVGDGESDERAARDVGCPFFRVCSPQTLADVWRKLGLTHV